MRYLLCILLSMPIISYSQADQLRAVIIVGDIQDRTNSAIQDMQVIHSFFKDKNVAVKTFYYPETNWDDIVKGSKDVNFLIYEGHGIEWSNGKYGGLSLNKSISSEDIIRDLSLSRNALILFKSVCGGAGSSASDNGDIGGGKALDRVSNYALPFFKIGASAYYANNYTGGLISFLNDFFEGKPIKECFDNSISWSAKLHIDKYYRYDNTKSISIAGSKGEGMVTLTTYENGNKTTKKVPNTKRYSLAYVANSRFSFSDLKSK